MGKAGSARCTEIIVLALELHRVQGFEDVIPQPHDSAVEPWRMATNTTEKRRKS